MTSNGTRDVRFVALLTAAGFASGALAVALSEGRFSYGFGVPFAVIMAFCLVLTGVSRSVGKLVLLVGLTAGAFFISVATAAMTELATRKVLAEVRETVYPTSLFAGGMIGAFITFGGAVLLIRPHLGPWRIASRAILCSLLEGGLAPIAWALGPSLGVWVWSGLHAAGLTGQANTLSNVLYGETGYGPPDRIFALLVVWQTVMGLALGINLRPSETNISFEGSEPL